MMMIHLIDPEKTVAIDFKDQTPSRATTDNPALFENGRLKTHGPAAVNIPGVVAGMGAAFEKYGSGVVSWADLIAPAARAAAEGVEVTLGLASSLAEGKLYLKECQAAMRIFMPEGKPLQAGDVLVNEDYGRTLQKIADEGADAFYRGSIADAIVRDMKTNGGIISAQDLSDYRALEREPLVGHYRDFEIRTAPPPVASGASLLQMLHILDHYPLGENPHFRSNTDSFHYMVEAWKNISRQRLVADPHHWEVDLSEVLSKEWARTRFAQIDPLKASPEPLLPENEDELEDYRRERISTGTTAAVVADSKGNMVALTQTLSTWGGAFYVSEGLGFLYNDHLRNFRARPGRMGSLKPLARSSTGICPTLVFRQRGEDLVPYLAVGAAGNAWITASVYQLIAGIIDFGLSPQEAIESPRFLVRRKRFPRDGPPIAGRVQYEQSISGAVIQEMRQRGHIFEAIGMKGELSMGFAAVAVVDIDNGVVRAGAEPRRSHDANGLQ
jgi:gamma-glutamyltranspeptidase/glutathione hydrolase